MNPVWLEFLATQHAVVEDKGDIRFPQPSTQGFEVVPITHWAVTAVLGMDAQSFLQGQLTCNLNLLNAETGSIAALCNPQGRVISPVWVIKNRDDDFWLVTPTPLQDTVIKTLRKYILRAKVQLLDQRDRLCMMSLQTNGDMPPNFELPDKPNQVLGHGGLRLLRLTTQPRYWVIAPAEAMIQFCQDLMPCVAVSFLDSSHGLYQDIGAGLPWFKPEQSEKYIPQMLNIDKLGGISFNKGCYTGQEIVARTHYLGKAKRALFVAECESPVTIANGGIIAAETQQQMGQVLAWASDGQHTRLLIVLNHADELPQNLRLTDAPNLQLTLLPEH